MSFNGIHRVMGQEEETSKGLNTVAVRVRMLLALGPAAEVFL